MNNCPFHSASNKNFFRPANFLSTNLFLSLFGAFFILVFANYCLAQKTTWRYVATVTDGKTYLNDEIKTLAGKHKMAWEKIIKSDGSSATAFVEWDCFGKRRLTNQITFYNSDQSVIGTKRSGFDWTPIIPDSTADYLYSRVCLPVPPMLWAQIISDRTALRNYPDNAAPITRTAKRGEKFQIIPETGKDNWYNVVDATTQEDYWLPGDSFEITTDAPTTQVAKGKSPNLQKSQRKKKPKSSRAGKN